MLYTQIKNKEMCLSLTKKPYFIKLLELDIPILISNYIYRYPQLQSIFYLLYLMQ